MKDNNKLIDYRYRFLNMSNSAIYSDIHNNLKKLLAIFSTLFLIQQVKDRSQNYYQAHEQIRDVVKNQSKLSV